MSYSWKHLRRHRPNCAASQSVVVSRHLLRTPFWPSHQKYWQIRYQMALVTQTWSLPRYVSNAKSIDICSSYLSPGKFWVHSSTGHVIATMRGSCCIAVSELLCCSCTSELHKDLDLYVRKYAWLGHCSCRLISTRNTATLSYNNIGQLYKIATDVVHEWTQNCVGPGLMGIVDAIGSYICTHMCACEHTHSTPCTVCDTGFILWICLYKFKLKWPVN